MPWSEQPSDGSAARLSEFESWKQGAEGRDGSAGTRRYVIDFGRVVKRLRGTAASPRAESGEMEPQVVALQTLAGPTSGLLASRDGELRAALSNLARRWRIWFQTDEVGDGQAAAARSTSRRRAARRRLPGSCCRQASRRRASCSSWS